MDLRNTSTPYQSSVNKARTLYENRTGITISRSTGEVFEPGYGYMVGGATPESLILNANTDQEKAVYQIARWIDRQPTFAGLDIQYLGIWEDTETGLIHLDVSSHVTELYLAESIGLTRGEIAIWDCERGEEIRLK